ncbi:MAG: sugar ABC transporter ATP-binding protein [Caldilineaceae bacterium]|nr:sugar ABC transporter ATP-binding protein [Caldilineaceae bacterium]
MRAICKAFGHVQALDQVDFDLRAGEAMALVGDNGAGKSTLIKCLSGVYQPDSGEILVDGRPVEIHSPSDSQRYGIATVYQDLALVDVFDVSCNVYLGQEPMYAGLFINYRKMTDAAAKVLSTLRIKIPSLGTSVSDLSGGQRQSVAIARALAWGGRIFLMDEPTAALGVEQSAKVNEIINDLKSHGKTVVVISHNLEHVFQVADRVTVLRQGKRVRPALSIRETSREEIVGLITGAIRPA